MTRYVGTEYSARTRHILTRMMNGISGIDELPSTSRPAIHLHPTKFARGLESENPQYMRRMDWKKCFLDRLGNKHDSRYTVDTQVSGIRVLVNIHHDHSLDAVTSFLGPVKPKRYPAIFRIWISSLPSVIRYLRWCLQICSKGRCLL